MARMQEYTVEAKVEVIVRKTVTSSNPSAAKRISVQSSDGWHFPTEVFPKFGDVLTVREGI